MKFRFNYEICDGVEKLEQELVRVRKAQEKFAKYSQEQVDKIINIIKSEFPEIEISGILLGYVAICYLGEPYEVHTLDVSGRIIEHYKSGQALPNGLEKARGIAMRGGYDFIEVYVDCCRAISSNGSVAVVSF